MQIFIIGMHRSGTSAVARILNMMGVYFGSEDVDIKVDNFNPKGYWERKDVWLMNEKILKSTHSEWYSVGSFSLEKIPEEAQKEFDDQAKSLILRLDSNRPWFIKDPRFCLTFPLWRKHLEFPVCIHVYRSPIQIAQSLRTRNQFSLHFGLALWEKYTLEALKATRDCPNLIVLHSELLSQPLHTANKLHEDLVGLGCRGIRLPHEKEILAFIDPALYRERGSREIQADFINRQQAELISSFEKGQILESFDILRDLSFGSREILETEGNAIIKIKELQSSLIKAQAQIVQFQSDYQQLQSNHQQLQSNHQQLQSNYQKECDTSNQKIKIQQQIIQELERQDDRNHQNIRQIALLIQKVQNDFNSIMQSWRWKVGDKIIRLAELILLRSSTPTAIDNIEKLFKQLQTIIVSLKPQAITKKSSYNQHTTNPKERPFKTFEQYLSCAMTNPNLLLAPLNEEDFRVISVMEHYKEQLTKKYQNFPQNDLISIVMPTYQRAKEIPLAISSILKQSYKNWQLIIIDDGGTDNTEEIVKSFSEQRISYIKLPKNKGNAVARNVGLSNIKGEFVCQLDSDDEWDENFLLIMLNEVKNQGALFGYSAQSVWSYFQDETESNKKLKVIRFSPFNRSLLENNNYISQIAVIFHRSLIDIVGKFDEEMKRYVDWEFFLRLSDHTFPIAIPVLLSHAYQNRTDQHVSTAYDRNQYMTLLRKKYYSKQAIGPLLDFKNTDSEISNLLKSCYANSRLSPAVPGPTKTTIVIPSYESISYLKLCIASIRKFTHQDYHIVLVDNKSGNEVREYLKDLANDSDITIILNDINYGFAYAINQGIERADPDSDIVLLNNDTLVTPGWLNAMQQVAEEIKDVGIVVPRQVLLASTETIKTHVPYADPHWETDTNLSAHHANIIDPFISPKNGWVELDYAPFFCVFITHECIKKCGLLDHKNGPHYSI